MPRGLESFAKFRLADFPSDEINCAVFHSRRDVAVSISGISYSSCDYPRLIVPTQSIWKNERKLIFFDEAARSSGSRVANCVLCVIVGEIDSVLVRVWEEL